MYWYFKTVWQNDLRFVPLFQTYLSHSFADAGRHVRTMKFLSTTERYVTLDRSVTNSRKRLYAACYWMLCKLLKSLSCNRTWVEASFIQLTEWGCAGGGCACMHVVISHLTKCSTELNQNFKLRFLKIQLPMVFDMISIAVTRCFKLWHATYAVGYQRIIQ